MHKIVFYSLLTLLIISSIILSIILYAKFGLTVCVIFLIVIGALLIIF